MKHKEISTNLFEMQQSKNEGRGILCIRSVCAYLDMGRMEEAECIVLYDWDKIANYPDIAKFLMNVRLAPHHWYIND